MNASSTDLLADRRYAWARALAAEGDHAAAADLLEQVMGRVPDWAPGWAALGESLESCGRTDEAIAAWRAVACRDRGGSLGAELHLARLQGLTPDGMAEDYVRSLFDDYAPRFERHLVDRLTYRGPALLAAALARAAPGRIFSRALDLGCGTGLMARALVDRVESIDGVDLSPAMVAEARGTALYAALHVGPLDDTLAGGSENAYDLVTAADVLVYVGDLAPVFAGTGRRLQAGGLLAFTLQTFGDGGPSDRRKGPRSFVLGPDLRFAHTADYAASALKDAGFRPLVLDEACTRREASAPVPGLVVVASRT